MMHPVEANAIIMNYHVIFCCIVQGHIIQIVISVKGFITAEQITFRLEKMLQKSMKRMGS